MPRRAVQRTLGVARATAQRHKSLATCASVNRGPKGFMSDDELLGEIRAVLGSSFFVAEGHRKVSLKMLVVLDEYTRECLAIEVERTFPGSRYRGSPR